MARGADAGDARAEVAIPRQMFQEILRLIAELRTFTANKPEECVPMSGKIAR